MRNKFGGYSKNCIFVIREARGGHVPTKVFEALDRTQTTPENIDNFHPAGNEFRSEKSVLRQKTHRELNHLSLNPQKSPEPWYANFLGHGNG